MNVTIEKAALTRSEEKGYTGSVQFRVDNHKEPYEITLHSDKGKEWMYSLHFLKESGSEEEILAVEEELEENDELFDRLVEAAMQELNR